MTERLLSCTLCLLVILMLAGCGLRQRQPGARSPRAGPIVEDLPADTWPDRPQEYPKDLLERLGHGRRPRDPLDHKVSFSFVGRRLGEVASVLSGLTGMGVTMLSDSDAAEFLHTRRVSLTMQDVRVADALDWIMRQVDAQYAWDGAGVCIASGKAKLFSDQLIEQVYPLRRMKLYDKPIRGFEDFESEKNAIVQCVNDLLAEYREYRPESRVVLTPQRGEFVAVCSPRAHRRIAEALREMTRGRENPPPSRAGDDTAEIKKKLEQVVDCAYRDRPVLEILGDLAIKSGVNIGVDPRELPAGENTKITLNYGRASLRFTLATITGLCGLEAYDIEPGRGVWLHGIKPYPAESRSLWEAGIIRSYYVEPSVEKIGLAVLLELIKQNITPGQWVGHLPALTYAPTGRLVVFHRPEAHAELATYLYTLERAVVSGEISSRDRGPN